MTPSLDDLAVFVAIAQERNVSSAAERLRVPKSSVSRALARLEAAMAVPLVHRTTRRLSLSTAGELLYERAAPLVVGLGEIVSGLPERREVPAGRLRITCTIDFGATVVAEIVTRFIARYPDVQVEVVSANEIVDLVREGIDLAIRFSARRQLRDSSLVATKVATLTTRLVASPEYVARRGEPRTPRELRDHDWVSYVGIEKHALEAPDVAEALAARGRVRCDDMFFAQAAARAGAGISALPSFLADPDFASGRLVPVLANWNTASGGIWAVHPAAHNVPAKVTAFRDMLVEAFAPPPRSRRR